MVGLSIALRQSGQDGFADVDVQRDMQCEHCGRGSTQHRLPSKGGKGASSGRARAERLDGGRLWGAYKAVAAAQLCRVSRWNEFFQANWAGWR